MGLYEERVLFWMELNGDIENKVGIRMMFEIVPATPKLEENRNGCKPEIRDEAHFWLNVYVNKQNCRIWSEANQQVYVETPLHPEKLTVWCALWAGGIIGPVTSSMVVNSQLSIHDRFYSFTSCSRTSITPIDCP
ncbi:hypothetical protein TNCV_4292861 [Trichonephila clavipes]|uniref:Uncharacterized protein n=1 Tax=Trichonephila clavipes TaxID=2585209 RepID=A0A8X6RFE7_TRICX|nr:hypothetical protein TNCV_4292861 [Trichonephila clavipes]